MKASHKKTPLMQPSSLVKVRATLNIKRQKKENDPRKYTQSHTQLQWEAFDLLDKMRYILWVVVALLEAANMVANLDFTRNLKSRKLKQENW